MTDTKLTLTRPEAAALVGLTPSGFDSWVRQGILPKPLPGTHRWSRAAIERALSGEPEKAEEDPYLKWKAEQARAAASEPKGKMRR